MSDCIHSSGNCAHRRDWIRRGAEEAYSTRVSVQTVPPFNRTSDVAALRQGQGVAFGLELVHFLRPRLHNGRDFGNDRPDGDLGAGHFVDASVADH